MYIYYIIYLFGRFFCIAFVGLGIFLIIEIIIVYDSFALFFVIKKKTENCFAIDVCSKNQ